MRRAVVAAVAVAALAASGVTETSPSRDDAFSRPDATLSPSPQLSPTPTPSPSRSMTGFEAMRTEQIHRNYDQIAPGVPYDVLDRRVALRPARRGLELQFAEEPSYAGSWYDLPTGLWHLLGNDRARLDDWAARARAKGIDPATRLVEYGRAELEVRAQRIRDGEDRLSRFSVLAGWDMETNRVHVKVLERPDVEDPMVIWVDYVGVIHAEITPG